MDKQRERYIVKEILKRTLPEHRWVLQQPLAGPWEPTLEDALAGVDRMREDLIAMREANEREDAGK